MLLAVIGCGSIGVRHARNALELGHRVVLYDNRPEAYEIFRPTGQYGHLFYQDSIVDVLWWCPDAVLICTPAHTHTSVLLQLRDAGYAGPIFVEKPICCSLAEARHWREWPHPVVMVGYQLRFHPALVALKASVPHPTSGGFYLDCDMRQWPGGDYGPIALEGSHELDAALFCGAPPRVSSVGVWMDTRATFRLDGDRWLIDLDGACSAYLRHWMLGPSNVPPTKFHSPEELGDQMYVDELAHFLRAVEGGPIAPGCTLEEGIAVLEVIEQAKRMAK